MRIDEALLLSERLKAVSDTARLDAELLLCHLLTKPRSYLFTRPEAMLDDDVANQFEALMARRETGEPVAHLIGTRDFWTLTLEVSPSTLIPRPDTETLVEAVLQRFTQPGLRVVDLGTGTGAIALALASERSDWQLVAVDRMPDAVALARRNRDRLQLSNVDILEGSWCEPLQGQYDLIVSNPPYIEPDDPHLQQGDLRFEPHSALVAGEQGLSDIQLIADQARGHLVESGWLIFEHGYNQAEQVQALLSELGYSELFTQRDLGDQPRVTGGCYSSSDTQTPVQTKQHTEQQSEQQAKPQTDPQNQLQAGPDDVE
ncbi:peptide chain release factor N(5)-glutamine methyltransferase [Nitrincola sp. MINF-07-Sa-05]|uniref:peptide chain release factor N(5)-glutamine methyltransferase n=1 Tax=Nitrincola salilacus TaxID=3400273 RepID=UPI00391806EF